MLREAPLHEMHEYPDMTDYAKRRTKRTKKTKSMRVQGKKPVILIDESVPLRLIDSPDQEPTPVEPKPREVTKRGLRFMENTDS